MNSAVAKSLTASRSAQRCHLVNCELIVLHRVRRTATIQNEVSNEKTTTGNRVNLEECDERRQRRGKV
jgi:hypothetical protein